MRRWLLSISKIGCTCSGHTCCHLHCYEVFKMHELWHIGLNKWNHEWYSEWSCDFGLNMASKKANFEFLSHISSIFGTPWCWCRTQTSSPDVTLHKQAGRYGPPGFEYLVAGQFFIQNVTHSCMFAKYATHLKPQPRRKPPHVSVRSAPRQAWPSMLSKFTKNSIIKNVNFMLSAT